MSDLLSELSNNEPITPETSDATPEEAAILASLGRVVENQNALGAVVGQMLRRLATIENVLDILLYTNPEISQKIEKVIQESQTKTEEVPNDEIEPSV